MPLLKMKESSMKKKRVLKMTLKLQALFIKIDRPYREREKMFCKKERIWKWPCSKKKTNQLNSACASLYSSRELFSTFKNHALLILGNQNTKIHSPQEALIRR